jgi:hypothetical protein
LDWPNYLTVLLCAFLSWDNNDGQLWRVLIRNNQEKVDDKVDASQGNLEPGRDPNNEKFEALQDSVVTQMDIHQARTMSTLGEMKAKMDEYST